MGVSDLVIEMTRMKSSTLRRAKTVKSIFKCVSIFPDWEFLDTTQLQVSVGDARACVKTILATWFSGLWPSIDRSILFTCRIRWEKPLGMYEEAEVAKLCNVILKCYFKCHPISNF